MPAGLYFLLGWIKPNHTAVFTESFIGMGMLAASLLLMILGGWMVKKIMNPDDD
jgi:tight adherence protein B